MQEWRQLGLEGMGPDSEYIVPWTFRSGAIGRMRRAGIQRLTGWEEGEITIAQLSDMFPDQNDWIQKMAESVRVAQYSRLAPLHGFPSTVKGLMDAFAYPGPLETLSMDTCLSADAGLLTCSSKFLQNHGATLMKCGHQYFKEHRLWPHAAIQIQLMLL